MSDILSSASLLLAILTTMFGLLYPSLKEILDIRPATHKPDNAANHKKAKMIRKTKLIPLLISSGILTLVFIPELVRQVNSSINIIEKDGFSNCMYDTVIASFIIVVFFMSTLTGVIIALTYEYQKKIKLLDPSG